MTIVARKDLEPTDLKGLVEYAKANKDTVTVANAGIGAASHLCGMMFMSAIDTPLVTVPYKGTGPAMTDLLGGQVDIMCDQTTNTTKQIQGGTIKAYAVHLAEASRRAARRADRQGRRPAAACRSASGTASTRPRARRPKSPSGCRSRCRWHSKDPNVVARFAELGTMPSSEADATPAALKAKLESEIARWKPIIEAAGQYAD